MISFDNCPLCQHDEIAALTTNGERFVTEIANICMNCGVGFLSPSMDEDDLTDYYASDQFSLDFRGGRAKPDKDKHLQNAERAERRWEMLKDILPEGGQLLEIGCSSGEFLDVAEQRFEVSGIDASSGYAAASTHHVVVGQFPAVTTDIESNIWDVIATFHTLEHVRDPREFLAEVHRLLSPEGLFVLEYPDLDKASYRVAFAETYFQKSHLMDFSTFNLVPLLMECGLEAIHISAGEVFPEDKNVLLVCRKVARRTIEYSSLREEAVALQEKIELKFKVVNLSHKAELKVVHIASFRINVGDGAIADGTRNLLSLSSGLSASFHNFDIVDYANNKPYITAEDINAYKPDLVIVGGGGTIDGHNSRKETGFAFTTPIEELEKINSKIAFVGLGHNVYRNQEVYHMDRLDEYVLFCKANDIPFSVRRDGSWERLSEVLSEDAMEHIAKIPDLGFFVTPEKDFESPHFTPHIDVEKRIVVQIALDAYGHRFGTGGDEESTKQLAVDFLAYMAEVIQKTITKHNASVCFATHTLADYQAVVGVIGSDFNRHLARLRVHGTGLYHPIYADRFFATYTQADLVIGMRGHSVICGTGLGVPTAAISTHRKVAGFMKEAGAFDWTVDHPRDDLFGDKLYEIVDELLEDPSRQLDAVKQSTQGWLNEAVDFVQEVLAGII